jgi:hypothetical protein
MLAGVPMLAALFLGIAVWNGFPLMYYDTAGYMVQGLARAFLPERSPVYSLLLLFTGGWISLWPVVILQALMTGYLIALTARIEVPGLPLKGLAWIGGGLMLLTGIGWYVGQVEPDCMTALLVLGCYLLLFRRDVLNLMACNLVVAITALAVASHPSHLGLIAGLLLAGGALRLSGRRWPGLPRPRLKSAAAAVAMALGLILASNLALAQSLFISRSGSVFLFARLMQDGIVQRLLHDTCPASGYQLCSYQRQLPHNANLWLWGSKSLFHREGGFANPEEQEEYDRIILDSLKRYPLMHIKAAVTDSVLQFFEFRTGDGIESQAFILWPEIKKVAPGQLAAYERARQQTQKFRFQVLNMIHVTVGMLSLLGIVMLLNHAVLKRSWGEVAWPGTVLLGLMGNAVICATFSNPHDRYQSRLMWLPALVLLLALAKNKDALHPEEESGT